MNPLPAEHLDQLPERPATGPGRELGQKRKPQLRLALGYRDETRRGAPVKTDYFIPRGSDIAVAKFQSVYGAEPRAVNIRLPGSLGGFLDIRHVAFAGGQNEDGGVLKAIGRTNFALEGTLGGPDMLTVWDAVETGERDRNDNPIRRLEVEEIYIDDVSDPAAQALGVYLQATVTFGIPDVLGFGGICEIRSRGKETIDTLWESAADIYGTLGSRASLILRPKLVLKESSMRTPTGGKAQLWVVDLYVPESLDEIVGRLREMRELMPSGPAAALYGPRALDEGSPVASPPADGDSTSAVASPDGAASSVPGDAAPSPENAPEPGADDDRLRKAAADQAALYVPPSGKYGERGAEGPKTIGEIFEIDVQYLQWASGNIKSPPEYVSALAAFSAVYLPGGEQ